MKLTYEQFKKEIQEAIYARPEHIRAGQAAFNYVNNTFGDVAQISQHKDGIDCFYDDSKIDAFIDNCYKIISNVK